MSKDPIEDKIREIFEQNYELLRLEGGHALTDNVKEDALNQVLMYWRKLKNIAKKVTDAEVRLSLPNQKTPKGRSFSIDGVVDIVSEKDQIHMYDVKTHDLDYIKGNKELYEEQLNVYAHIWQELRKNKLHFVAVISTALTESIKEALRSQSEERYMKAIEQWNPILQIGIEEKRLKKTIESFGKVVDEIEDGRFDCCSEEDLYQKFTGTKYTFAVKICSNCDGRFSCDTYRAYAKKATKGKAQEFAKYFESSLDREEQEDWLVGNSHFENE